MDLTFGAGTSTGYKSAIGERSRHNAIFAKLFQVPEFKTAFVERFRELYPGIESFIGDTMDEAVELAGNDLENEFAIRAGWGRYGTDAYKTAGSYAEAIDFMKEWTPERLVYLYDMYCK